MARVPRLRLDLSRGAGRRQRRARHRDPVRSQGRRPVPFGLCPISSLHLHALGLLDDAAPSVPPRRLGGWLKMGIVGTTPARGRVLLVGDAAGLVNPMQGEGISQAMTSGRAAAEAILTQAEPRRRELSVQTRRRTPPVSSDRRRSARRTCRTAPGNCSGRSASDRGGPRRCAFRRLGRFLERAPRWCTTQSASFGGERGDADRPSHDRPGCDGQGGSRRHWAEPQVRHGREPPRHSGRDPLAGLRHDHEGSILRVPGSP